MDAINKLSPEQRQAVMIQAQQEANGQIMREMINKMAQACFQKCAGTSVRSQARLIAELRCMCVCVCRFPKGGYTHQMHVKFTFLLPGRSFGL